MSPQPTCPVPVLGLTPSGKLEYCLVSGPELQHGRSSWRGQEGVRGTWHPLAEIMCKFMYIVIKEFRKWERFNRFRDPGSKGSRTASGRELAWPASNGGDQRSPALPPIIQWFKKFAKFSTELKVLRPESNWGHRIISFQWQWRVGGTVLRYVQNTTFLPTKEQYKILSMSLRSSWFSV